MSAVTLVHGHDEAYEPVFVGERRKELDELMTAVRPLTMTEWRSYLHGRPARPELLEADRVQDLPDGT